MKVTPNMHFNGECEEALGLYERAFGATVTRLYRYGDARPEDFSQQHLSDAERNRIYHAEMIVAGHRFMLSDSVEHIQKGQSLSLVITFDTVDEVKRAYSVIREGASIIHEMTETTYSGCFVSLVDRFGLRWELMTEDR